MPRLAPLLLAFALVFGSATGARAQDSFSYLDSGQWTFNKDCVARGDTLLAALTYGLQVWNVSNPADLQPVGDYYSDAHKTIKIDWLEDLIALTTQDGFLQIVDGADLAAPALHASLDGFGTYADVLLQDRGPQRFAFVAGSAGVKSVDLGDPANPVVLDDLDPGGSPRVITRSGNTLYVLASGGGLHTIDASDPSDLLLLDTDAIPVDYLLDIHVDGDKLAAATRSDGFWLFDLSDPADPVFAAQEIPGNRVKGVRIVGDTLFCAIDGDGLRVYDIANPAAPAMLGEDPDSWLYFEGLDIHGDRAYLDYWDGNNAGVQIFDLVNPAAPAWLGRSPGYDYCRYVDSDGDKVYTATGHQGVIVHQVLPAGDGARLELLGRLPVLNTWALDAVGDTVYVASASSGFVIADFSDPANPVEIGSLDLGICRAVRVVGDLAYVGVFGQGLATVDLSDPTQPVLLDQVTIGFETVGLDVAGGIVATADRDDGVNLWDVGDPASIQWLGNSPTGSNRAQDVRFLPGTDLLYAAAGAVRIIDVSNPGFPLETGDFGSGSQGLLLGSPTRLFVAQNGSGVYAYDLALPTQPAQLDRYNTADNAYSVARIDDMIFVADYSALIGLRFETLTAAPSIPIPGTLALRAYPNPFNPRTDLQFSLETDGRVRVEIFDVRGRRLALIDEGDYAAGTHTLRWNGRDAKGQGLPSGVYLARLAFEKDGARAFGSRKLILVR